MNNTFNGKTALIICGSSGMGKATAQLLLTRGAKVVIASKSKDSVTAAVAELKNYGDVAGKVVNLGSEQDGGGAIVNIGSYWANHATKGTPTSTYTMAKAGLQALKNHELDRLMEGKYLRLFTDQRYENTDIGNKLIESLLFDKDIQTLFWLN